MPPFAALVGLFLLGLLGPPAAGACVGAFNCARVATLSVINEGF